MAAIAEAAKSRWLVKDTSTRCWSSSQISMHRRKQVVSRGRLLVQENHLVLQHVALLRHRSLLHYPVVGVLFQTRDQAHPFRRQLRKPSVIGLAPIERQNRSRLEIHLSRHLDLVRVGRRDHRERGQVSFVVQQQMQLYRPFGLRNLAQAYREAHRSITLPSMLISGFLKRNFRRPSAAAT